MKEKSKEPEVVEPEPEPTTEVLFLCSYEGCGKTFIDAGALRKHSHIHGERQYVCHYENCGKVIWPPGEFWHEWHNHKNRLTCSYIIVPTIEHESALKQQVSFQEKGKNALATYTLQINKRMEGIKLLMPWIRDVGKWCINVFLIFCSLWRELELYNSLTDA